MIALGYQPPSAKVATQPTALMGQERIGVIVLRPDGAVEQLATLIDQLLDV